MRRHNSDKECENKIMRRRSCPKFVHRCQFHKYETLFTYKLLIHDDILLTCCDWEHSEDVDLADSGVEKEDSATLGRQLEREDVAWHLLKSPVV